MVHDRAPGSASSHYKQWNTEEVGLAIRQRYVTLKCRHAWTACVHQVSAARRYLSLGTEFASLADARV
jgi:hypothetical protein